MRAQEKNSLTRLLHSYGLGFVLFNCHSQEMWRIHNPHIYLLLELQIIILKSKIQKE